MHDPDNTTIPRLKPVLEVERPKLHKVLLVNDDFTPRARHTPVTVTLKQLAAELAEANELTKKQIETMLSSLVEMVAIRLKAGDKVRPTGLSIEIKASRKVAFGVAKKLKDAV